MDEKSKKSAHQRHHEENWGNVNWRSWGSWFSWGSPVGLGLFFIAICFCIWLLGQTFGWQ